MGLCGGYTGAVTYMSYKDINSNEFFMINVKNEIMKIVFTGGQVIWNTNLVVNDELNNKLRDAYLC
ncbi:hypothetical protein [Wolbachia endosymbiont of Wuchereria bancrofti]|uniref:hypothetical protein n=1 Tax=Wolbachia endosymbiont of Wuchereria bancrofti TaxID=96496 RepID=UPI00034BF821|nr:hypothetical protein [Wolbachia endosymbiont of Wuchereria bancrofti]OWZ25532.1 PQQ enzyme repeat family domain protein [Wolbachia endosymbiont of Wuchereria bancrofti]